LAGATPPLMPQKLSHPPAAADRFPVLYLRGSRVYAAWSADQGAYADGRALLIRGADAIVDTLRVAWVTDDISALEFTSVAILTPVTETSDLCVVSLAPRSGRPEGTLAVPLSALPATLDPAHVTSLAEKQVGTQIYQGLTALVSGSPVLAAADSLLPAEPLGYIFRLHPEGRFQNGRLLRSADVVASLLRVLSPATHAERIGPLLDTIAGARDYHEGRATEISGLSAPDSLTVRVTACGPGAWVTTALATPAAWILPADVAKAPAADFTPIGSGAFCFVRTDSLGVLLTASPERTSGVDTLRFRLVNGPEDAALQFELGRLDLVSPPAAEEARLATARPSSRPGAGALRLSVREDALYYLGINTRSPWLAERAHRRALAGAIDRDLAVRVLVGDRGELAHGVVPWTMSGQLRVGGELEWLAMSKEAESLPGMSPPSGGLQFWVPAGSAVGERVAEFVQAALGRHGLRVRIVTRPWSTFEHGLDTGQADLFFLSWYADTPDAAEFLAALFSSATRGAGGNHSWYTSPPVDSLFARGRDASDQAARMDALAQAQRLIIADAPILPLYEPINVTLVRPGVRGLVLDPLGCPRYDTVEVRRGR
jgi:ABC-type transport system substrate-binding protein